MSISPLPAEPERNYDKPLPPTPLKRVPEARVSEPPTNINFDASLELLRNPLFVEDPEPSSRTASMRPGEFDDLLSNAGFLTDDTSTDRSSIDPSDLWSDESSTSMPEPVQVPRSVYRAGEEEVKKKESSLLSFLKMPLKLPSLFSRAANAISKEAGSAASTIKQHTYDIIKEKVGEFKGGSTYMTEAHPKHPRSKEWRL